MNHDDLIREARECRGCEPTACAYTIDIITRLADALERCGAELERANHLFAGTMATNIAEVTELRQSLRRCRSYIVALRMKRDDLTARALAAEAALAKATADAERLRSDAEYQRLAKGMVGRVAHVWELDPNEYMVEHTLLMALYDVRDADRAALRPPENTNGYE